MMLLMTETFKGSYININAESSFGKWSFSIFLPHLKKYFLRDRRQES